MRCSRRLPLLRSFSSGLTLDWCDISSGNSTVLRVPASETEKPRSTVSVMSKKLMPS